MTFIISAFLALLFLGLPFYWGAFGHNGAAVPIVWGVVVAIAVSLRRWRNVDASMVPAFALTLLVSLGACTLAFAVGRFLSR